jgi:hypothetical protein
MSGSPKKDRDEIDLSQYRRGTSNPPAPKPPAKPKKPKSSK